MNAVPEPLLLMVIPVVALSVTPYNDEPPGPNGCKAIEPEPLPDGLPVLGRSSASARVVYAFGHQHIGLTLGGLSGMIVADQVAGRPSVLGLEPFAASRFD